MNNLTKAIHNNNGDTMYIEKRFNRDGILIENPKTYIPQFSEELKKALGEIYSRQIENFDENRR